MTIESGTAMSRLKLRAAPDRVFLRMEGIEGAPSPFVELTPAEALRAAQALTELARDAIRDGNDSAPLRGGAAPWFAQRLAAN